MEYRRMPAAACRLPHALDRLLTTAYHWPHVFDRMGPLAGAVATFSL